jgi:hypothetical protein
MSSGIAAITQETSSHIAAGNGYAINRYIQELEAMGFSARNIERTLVREGLSVVPVRSDLRESEAASVSKEEPSCRQIEDALGDLDFERATLELRAFKHSSGVTRQGQFRQLQCLRMRIEYRHGQGSNVYKMLMNVLGG